MGNDRFLERDDHPAERREGPETRRVDEPEGRRASDVRIDHKFAWDIFKWVAVMFISLIGIYVISEKRAVVSEMSNAHMDRKTDEIKTEIKDNARDMNTRFDAINRDMNAKFGDLNGRLDTLQSAQNGVSKESAAMREALRATDERVKDQRAAQKEADGMLEAQIITLRNQLSQLQAIQAQTKTNAN